MKKLGVAFIILLMTTPAIAADKWTTQDYVLEATWESLHIIDYGQSLNIANSPSRYWEINPLLGSHPSKENVHLFMISTAILHPIISHFLPRHFEILGFDIHPRTSFQSISIGISSGLVAYNYSIGLQLAF